MRLTPETLAAEALKEWMGEQQSSYPMRGSTIDAVFNTLSPILDSAEHADLVREIISAMVKSYDRGSINAWRVEERAIKSVLQGDTWRSFLGSQEDGRTLACIIILYMERDRSNLRNRLVPGVSVPGNIAAPLRGMLDSWIAPMRNSITLRDFSRELFGDAWCTLVLDTYADSVSLAEIIEKTTPLLLPNRLAAGADISQEALPALEGM